MAQIRWDNINSPNFGSANSLLQSGQEGITQGLEQLQGLAQEQTELANINYDTGKQQNTDDLVNQLMKADTQEALNQVDLEVFGQKVDGQQLNQAFAQRQGDLEDQANADRNYQLSSDKFQQDIYEFGELQKHRQNELDHRMQMDQANLAVNQAKLKNTNNKKAIKQFNLMVDNTANDAIKLHPEGKQEYLNYMNKLLSGSNQFTASEITKKLGEYDVLYDGYYAMTPDQQTVFNEQQTTNTATMEAVNSKLDQYDGQISEIIGTPVDVFNYANDDSVGITDVKAKWKDANVNGIWAGEMDVDAAYNTITRELGRPPTGKELEHMLTEASRNSEGRWTAAGSIQDAATNYKSQVLESEYRDVVLDHQAARNNATFKAQDTLDKASRTTQTKLNAARNDGSVYNEGVISYKADDLLGDINKSASDVIAELSKKKMGKIDITPVPKVQGTTSTQFYSPNISGYSFQQK